MDQPPAICCLILIAFTALCSFMGFTRKGFLEKYWFSPHSVIWNRQYYRLVSSGFVHVNWGHLLFNMFSLYAFGSGIELIFGIPTFLAIYFASILGGSLVSLYLHRHHDYQAVGASGGVCGIIFASLFLLPGGAVFLFFVPIPIPGWLYAILFLVVSFFALRSQIGNIGHDAHLGGAIIGLATTTVLYPVIVLDQPALYATVMGLALLMTAYLYKYPPYMPRGNIFNREFWQNLSTAIRQRLRRHRVAKNEQTLDRLLQKIAKGGRDSLTRSEARRLESISRQKARDRLG